MNENEIYQVHPDLASSPLSAGIAPASTPMLSAPTEEPEPVVEAMEEEAPLLQEAVAPREDHPNFRSLKEKADRERDRADRERERADRLEALIRKNEQQFAQAQPQQEERYSDDDFITGKHLSSWERKRQEEARQLREDLAKTRQQMTDTMLRTSFPDIGKVLSEENVMRLAEQEPEIAQGLDNIPDYASKVQATYKAIKRLGIYVEDNYVKDRARVQANAAKPKNSAAVAPQTGNSPLSRANAFANDEDVSEQAQLARYAEMQKWANMR